MDSAPNHPLAVTPHRAVLVLIAALASGVGLLPYLLFIDRLHYLWAVVPGAALAAFFALRDLKSPAGSHPSLGEWLLGAWSAVAKPSTGSLGGLIFYAMFYWGQKGYVGVAQYLGFAAGGDASAWGLWGSIWLAGAAALMGATEGTQDLGRQLYPREAWARSAFHSLLTRSGAMLAAAIAAIVAVGAMFWQLDVHGVALPAALAALFFYTSLPLAELGEVAHDRVHSRVVDAVAAVLESAGYRVVRSPRTGKPEIDPLLKSVDLLAKRDELAYAVEVKSVEAGVPVEWNEANAVCTAAALLSTEIVADDGAPVGVRALLVLAGGSLAQSLQAYSQRERVPVVHLDKPAAAIADHRLIGQRLEQAGVVLAKPPPTAPAPA